MNAHSRIRFDQWDEDMLAAVWQADAWETRRRMNKVGAQDIVLAERPKRGESSHDKIVEWAGTCRAPFTANQITKALNSKSGTIYPAITTLVARGVLTEVGKTQRVAVGCASKLVAEYMLTERIASVKPPQSGLKSAQPTPPASAHGRNAKPASGAKSGV
jgi:hypothetical protein